MSSQNKLRPTNFDTYVGQTHAMSGLKVMVKSAEKRDCACGHLLFSGPPGLGKTTIAQVIANEIGTNLHFVNAPNITSNGKLAQELCKLGERDVLFIDEIHQLRLSVEEYLYPAMEDNTIELRVGADRRKRTEQLPLSNFTLIGATTQAGNISSPLRTRFQDVIRMKYYSVKELGEIVKASAKKLSVPITDGGALEVARRARGTPRTANQHLTILRDHAVVEEVDTVDRKYVKDVLSSNGIDPKGLQLADRLYLKALKDHSMAGPIGLNTICGIVDEEKKTIEETIEPFLLRQGLVEKTPRGRRITDKGIEHMRST